jgi:hypothetical protein
MIRFQSHLPLEKSISTIMAYRMPLPASLAAKRTMPEEEKYASLYFLFRHPTVIPYRNPGPMG